MNLRIPLVFCLLLISVSSAFGQSANEEVRKGFNEVNDWMLKAAEAVPADKYNYKPVDTVRTFGQLVAHITDSYNYFCTRATGNKVEWSEAVEKANLDKDALLSKFKESAGRCTAAYGAANSQLGPLMGNVGHTSLHYGNLITYMRMMGLKPPSS
jgi:uncharacterized damage-inducible protein DinB